MWESIMEPAPPPFLLSQFFEGIRLHFYGRLPVAIYPSVTCLGLRQLHPFQGLEGPRAHFMGAKL